MKSPKRDAKTWLRELVTRRLASCPYVSVVAVRNDLAKAVGKLQPATVNRYLVEFHQAGLIHNAGRGWYSSLSTPFALATQPVSDLAALLQKQFPFLKCACWSTDQVKPFMQHLLARNIQFVSAESHTLASVGEFLQSNDFTVYVNPTKSEARRFGQLKERTIVLRPSHSKEPKGHPFARIEKLLVDLRGEVDCLRLMDVSEYHHLANEAVRQGRVQMASLLSYAEARLFAAEDLFGKEQSTISNNR